MKNSITGEETRPARPATTRREISTGRWMAAAAIALLVLIGAGLYAWRAGRRPDELTALGYPGVFLLMLISGAGTFFPMPGQAAVLVAGALWNPILVGIAAGLGNATGELFGYALGWAGEEVALKGRTMPRWWSLLRGWLSRYGFVTILVIALVPNPLFDVVGLLAGSLGYPARRFWLACALGNTVKYVAYAYLGDMAQVLLR